MMEKKSILVVEQNMNFNEVFVEHLSYLNYNIGNFFESWDKPFQYTRWAKLKNLFHRNILGNKHYIEVLKQNQYDQFCKKCIRDFEKKFLGQFDYCLVFRADRLPEFLILYLRNKARKIVAYQYDGLSQTKNILNYKKYFDHIFIFDPFEIHNLSNDCRFTTNYHFSLKSIDTIYFTLYYLGTWQRSRYNGIIKLLKNIPNSKNKIVLCDPNQVCDNPDVMICHNHIPYKNYLKEIKFAKVLIDIKLEDHNGLSFRFFEALNLEKKTDNK